MSVYIEFLYDTGPEAGTYDLIGPFSSVPAAQQHKDTYGPVNGQIKIMALISAQDAGSGKQPETAEEWASSVLSLKDLLTAEWGETDSKHVRARVSMEAYVKYKKMREQLKNSWTDWTPEQKEIARASFKEVGKFILSKGFDIEPDQIGDDPE